MSERGSPSPRTRTRSTKRARLRGGPSGGGLKGHRSLTPDAAAHQEGDDSRGRGKLRRESLGGSFRDLQPSAESSRADLSKQPGGVSPRCRRQSAGGGCPGDRRIPVVPRRLGSPGRCYPPPREYAQPRLLGSTQEEAGRGVSAFRPPPHLTRPLPGHVPTRPGKKRNWKRGRADLAMGSEHTSD